MTAVEAKSDVEPLPRSSSEIKYEHQIYWAKRGTKPGLTVYCLPVLGILNRLFFGELLAVTVND